MKINQPFVFALVLASLFSAAANATHLSSQENSRSVKTGNKFITLLGDPLAVGDVAPNFKAVNGSFSPVKLSDFSDSNVLISVVPSVDTGVCSIQTKHFNEAVEKLNNDTIIITISNDLPFAQRRFCSIEKVNNLVVLSDAVWHEFAYAYGVMIKDMGLLTRSIFVINKEQKIVYKELVENISDEPDYSAALIALTSIPEPVIEATAPKVVK